MLLGPVGASLHVPPALYPSQIDANPLALDLGSYTRPMITLFPTRLHWIKDDGADDPVDLCAHSPVCFQVDGDTLVAPEDGDVTVSAASVYLLRTLERNHTKEEPIGDQLFPCCGHAMYDTGDQDVAICGCSNGRDVFVTHEAGGSVRLSLPNGKSYVVSSAEWQQAAQNFSDAVYQFYARSLPKTPGDETDSAGFAKLMAEWNRRRS